jgi:hypothetical protein
MRVDAPIGAEPSWIASADAYAPGLKTPPAAGSYAICQRRDAWLPCQIDGVDGGRVQAHDASGRTLDVGLAQLIAPRAMTELNLKRHFQSAAGRKAFEAAVAVAGSPPRADGWLPMPRSGVIARREGRYYSAEIYEFDEEVPRVRFALDGRVTEIPVSELYPEPPYDLGQLRRGDFVLRRPPGPPEPWQPVQVRSLGNAELRVANLEGEVAAVPVRDVIPLGEKREGP